MGPTIPSLQSKKTVTELQCINTIISAKSHITPPQQHKMQHILLVVSSPWILLLSLAIINGKKLEACTKEQGSTDEIRAYIGI